MRRACLTVLALAVAGAAAAAAWGVGPSASRALLPSFAQIGTGPAGGTVWSGVIPNGTYPRWHRISIVYLPPDFSPRRRYPTLFVLHGIRGTPYSIANGLRFADVADSEIVAGRVRPFLAVMPPAGLTARFDGEWTGVWEHYVIHDVLPWAEGDLPALPFRSDRAIAGLSAGGFGAADIGLRHPRQFGTIQSWSGSFKAPHDGSLRHASVERLAANDPTRLAQTKAALLRRLGTRFFVSCGTGDSGNLVRAIKFARLLSELGLPHRSYFGIGGHNGRFWQAQLPEALRYAFPDYGSTV